MYFYPDNLLESILLFQKGTFNYKQMTQEQKMHSKTNIQDRLIQLFSYQGEIILDPFCGSGTSLKVARNLNRHAIGIEIKEDLKTIIQKKVLGQEKDLLFDEKEAHLEFVYRKS